MSTQPANANACVRLESCCLLAMVRENLRMREALERIATQAPVIYDADGPIPVWKLWPKMAKEALDQAR